MNGRRRKSRGQQEQPFGGNSPPRTPPRSPQRAPPHSPSYQSQSPRKSPPQQPVDIWSSQGEPAGAGYISPPSLRRSLRVQISAGEGSPQLMDMSPSEQDASAAAPPESQYWANRHRTGVSSQNPPFRTPQRHSAEDVPGPEYWEKIRLEGSSTAVQPTLGATSSQPEKASALETDLWRFPMGTLPPARAGRTSLLDCYPRATEEKPYKQKHILKKRKDSSQSGTRRTAKPRRRSRGAAEEGSSSSSTSTSSSITVDEDEVSWVHFKEVKDLDWNEHWKDSNPSAPDPGARQSWTHKSGSLYLARHTPTLVNSHGELDYFQEEAEEETEAETEEESSTDDADNGAAGR